MGRPKKFDPDTAVAKAMQVFWVDGYAETSPQDLADSMGIGKGSLYNTFGRKHEVFVKSLEHYTDVSVGELTAIMDSPAPIRDRVRTFLTGYVDRDPTAPEQRGCLIVNTAAEMGSRDEPVARLVRRSVERNEAILASAFVAAQASGEIAPDQDPYGLAKLVQTTMMGICVLVRSGTDRPGLLAVVDAAVRAI